jgi:predicted MFS family arabinose efflux permease
MKRNVVLLALGAFVTGVSMRVAEPLLPRLAGEFSSSVTEVSAIITGFAFGYGIFQFVHGPLGDRYGRLRIAAAGCFLAAIASAACAGAQTVVQLMAFRVVAGMTGGGMVALGLAYIGDTVPLGERQATIGRFITGSLLGQAAGPFIGGALSGLIGWRASFVAIAASYAAVGLVLAPAGLRTPPPGAPIGNVLVRYAELLTRPQVRLVMTVEFIEALFFFGAFAYLGAYFKLRFALPDVVVGALLAGFGIGGLLFSATVQAITRRLTQPQLVTRGGVVMLLCLGAVAAAPDWRIAAPIIIVLGYGFYMLHNTAQVRSTEMAPDARGAGIALAVMGWFLGQAAGVAMMGLVVERAGYVPMIALAGCGLLGLCLWFARRLAPSGSRPDRQG